MGARTRPVSPSAQACASAGVAATKASDGAAAKPAVPSAKPISCTVTRRRSSASSVSLVRKMLRTRAMQGDRIDGLHEEFVGARFERRDARGVGAGFGEEDDGEPRERGVGAERAQERHAVEVGEAFVGDEEVGAVGVERGHDLGPRGGDRHGVVRLGQPGAEEDPAGGGGVRDQDAAGHRASRLQFGAKSSRPVQGSPR